MTMLETKKEIETALYNDGKLSFDALTNAYLAVRFYVDNYGDAGVTLGIDLSEVGTE